MGHGAEMFKHFAILAVALACVVFYAETAPINGEELLSNIENAAETEVNKAQETAERMQAQASAEEKQLEANKAFAVEMMSKVKDDTKSLESMSDKEQKTIEDAKGIEADVGTRDISDIQAKDADATQLSNEIQQTAEAVDNDLRADISQLKDVGVSKLKKTTSLGETVKHLQFPDDKSESFRDRLTNVETEAKGMVDSAKEEAKQATMKKEELDSQLNSMNSEAKTGLKQLKQAETQLHRDLAGHRDAELENDIEQQVEAVDNQSVENVADGTSALDAGSDDGTSPDFTPKLGESPLEAAEKAAEEAAAMNDSPDSNVNNEGSQGTLAAIEKDAEELVTYQKSSMNEI